MFNTPIKNTLAAASIALTSSFAQADEPTSLIEQDGLAAESVIRPLFTWDKQARLSLNLPDYQPNMLEIPTRIILTTYHNMKRSGGDFEGDIQTIMPLLYRKIGSIEHILVEQSECFLPSKSQTGLHFVAQEASLSVGLHLKKMMDNSLEFHFIKGPYAGTNFLYSPADRSAMMNHYSLRSKDGYLYDFPDQTFVSQAIMTGTGGVMDVSAQPEEKHTTIEYLDLYSFDIAGDLETGYVSVKEPGGSTVSLDLKAGLLTTTGQAFGTNVMLEFKPADEVIATHVYKLASEIPTENFVKNTEWEDSRNCPSTQIPVLEPATP